MKLSRVNFLSFLGILSIITTVSCKHGDKEASAGAAGKPKGVAAEAYIVQPQVFSNAYTSSGSMLPNEEVEIHPEMSGRVTNISFREGMAVRKGQLLIQLFDGDLRAQVQKLQTQRRLQQNTAGRQKELLNIGGISKQDYEATQTSVSSYDADIAVAQAALSKMRVLAPFDGIIGLRNISIGAVISPTTLVATLQQVNPLKMDFSIPDQYRTMLRMGQEVRFSVDGNLDTLMGKISAIEPGADMQSRSVKVRALVANGNGKLTAGAFAHVIIPFTTNEHALLIPSQCIIPTTRDKKVALVKNGKAAMTTVQVGVRTADKVEIISGVQAGDTILTTALMQVKDKMDIKVKKITL